MITEVIYTFINYDSDGVDLWKCECGFSVRVQSSINGDLDTACWQVCPACTHKIKEFNTDNWDG